MRLIGSRTEQENRDQLVRSHNALFADRDDRLLRELQTRFPDMRTAYILGWTPEQDEDWYVVLININIIATIVIDRYDQNASVTVETETISDYLKGLSKSGQIQLAVALDLAENDLKR